MRGILLSLLTAMDPIIIAPLIIALLCVALLVYSKYEALRWGREYVDPRVQATEAYYQRPISPVIFASHKPHPHATVWTTHSSA